MKIVWKGKQIFPKESNLVDHTSTNNMKPENKSTNRKLCGNNEKGLKYIKRIITNKNKSTNEEGKHCKMGECENADVALIGCYLMKAGVVREEKEAIKKKVFEMIVAHRKNAEQKGYERGRQYITFDTDGTVKNAWQIREETKKEIIEKVKYLYATHPSTSATKAHHTGFLPKPLSTK